MILNMTGGGAGLNFKVVGNPQPTNPKENTIWINTDTAITSWIFSATEPESPVEGAVWIETGTSGEASFNALKKGSIYIFPKSAKQYIGGALVRKEAFIYDGNEWVEWLTYLYKSGNQFTAVTGGWGKDGASINADSMYVHSSGSGTYSGWVYTKNKIDFSNINTLYIKCSSLTNSVRGPRVGVCNSTDPYNGYVVSVDMTSLECAVDVSGVNTSCYIVFAGNPNGGGGYITEVYY